MHSFLAALAAAVATAGPIGDCPAGTEPTGAAPPAGTAMWCQKVVREPDGSWQKHGPYAAWYHGGELKERGAYQDGKPNGLWTWWYEGGQKREEGNYRVGVKIGPWTSWWSGGQTRSETLFRSGKESGKVVTWHANGVKESETDYRDGAVVGTVKRWDESGAPVVEKAPAASEAGGGEEGIAATAQLDVAVDLKGPADVDPAKLTKFLKERAAVLKHCYEAGLPTASPGGRLSVKFQIGSGGKADGVELLEDTVGSREFADCVITDLAYWHAPVKPSAPVAVRLDFKFAVARP